MSSAAVALAKSDNLTSCKAGSTCSLLLKVSDVHNRICYLPLAILQMKLPIAVDDIRREVAILKLLTGHPNVVQFLDVFEDNTTVYIAME